MQRLILLAAFVAVASAATGPFDYDHQDTWGGFCQTGTRQSPIAVDSETTVDNDKLLDLVLSGWSEERDGVFANTGTSVKFTPDADETVATTTNHLGVYETLQFHMHWGRNDGQGSEHVVDDAPASAEIHFVLKKRGDTSGDQGDLYAVVGVMAVADDDAEISGVWRALSVKDVQGHGNSVSTAVRYSDLLPSDLSYYFYEGSLTTPNCDEVVQWFLLRETISIPKRYLKKLRKVEKNNAGDYLTYNYRNTQDLKGREVALHGGSEGLRPLLPVTLLLLVVLFMF
jgi:carbonic anhydrase